MAMIRSNASVFNKPIGVIRSDVGGAQIGNAISRVADGFAERAYRKAAAEAEDAGAKAATAKSSSSIIAINPETGLPEAYEAPSNFGSIAAASYQNMIDRRFEDSINQEIKTRAQEVVSEGGGSDHFKRRMTGYVEQMYSNAIGEDGELNAYGRIIQETGTAYVASTYNALRNKEAQAAKAELKRQNEFSVWQSTRELTALAQSGADTSIILERAADLRERAGDIYATGGSLSAYSKVIEETEGLVSIAATGELSQMYLSLSEIDQSRFKMALMQPQNLNAFPKEIKELAHLALATSSASSLISGFDSLSGTEDEFQQGVVDAVLAEHSIGADTSNTQIAAYSLSIPDPEARAEYVTEASTQMVIASAGANIDDVENLDVLMNELQNPNGANYGKVRDIVGVSAAGAINGMSADVRQGIAETLNKRRSALNAVGISEENQLKSTLGFQARDIANSNDPATAFSQFRERLSISGLDASEVKRLEENAGRVAVNRAASLALQTEVTYNEMQAIRGLVLSGGSPDGLSENAALVFEQYNSVYRVQASTVDSEMGRRLEGLSRTHKKSVDDSLASAALSAARNGSPLSADDSKLIDEGPLANITTAVDLIGSPVARSIMDQGVFTPKMAMLLESAINSTNEEIVSAGTALFEMYSRVQLDSDRGESVEADYMRRTLSPETYSSYSAASYAKTKLGISPVVAMVQLNNYEGGMAKLDADIKRGLSFPDSHDISRALTVYDMSQEYKTEVLSMLRMMQAQGQTVNRDTIDSWIKDFNDKAIKDDRVVGPRVGDQTVYALRNHLSIGEIVGGINDLADLVSQAPELQDMMRGGTFTDATAAQVLGAADAFSAFRASAAFMERFTGGYEASVGQSMQARIRQGLQAISVDLRFKPDVAAFRAGTPSYYVGYEENGMFVNIEVNDEPYRLQKQIDSSGLFDTYVGRSSAYNELILAQNSNADPDVTAELTIKYFATLDYMTEDSFLDSPEYRKLNRALPNGNALELFRQAKDAAQ